jgi:hypothetical protein
VPMSRGRNADEILAFVEETAKLVA